MEKEYTVIVNNREDLAVIETELTASSGAGPIPSRSIGIANPRLGSKIQTHFMLTDEEAEALRSDPRVRAVEIPPEQRTDVQIGKNASQTAEYTRDETNDAEKVNWGLLRSNYKTNVYGALDNAGTVFEYALDGTGVDVVIQDSGIQADHPEWEDADGVSRLQEINWYTESGISGTQDANFYSDYDGHGTHCAGIAAGKTYGWAKGAHIYAQKLAGLEGATDPGNGIGISNAFDTIRLWHNAKTNGRPTVVNMSWGYSFTTNQDPTGGVYRGTSWAWPADYNNNTTLWSATGVVSPYQNGDRQIPSRLVSIDAEVEDMITDGIHICIAAGNNYYKADVVGGPDYNNTVTFGGVTENYARGSSPYSDNAFMVGNITAVPKQDGADYLDKKSASSTSGPGVGIWAPGDGIMSTSSNTSIYVTTAYPADASYKIMAIGGTSMAAPQVAGVAALHLQVFPDATPAQLQARIQADAQAVIYDTGSSTDYSNQESILGSTNRMLWNRYGRQPGQISRSDTIIAPPLPTYSLSTTSTTVNEGATVRVTLNTQYVPNGTNVDYTITGITSADLSAGNLTGNFTIQNNTDFVEFTLANDLNTEGTETITFALDNSADSLQITVTDTSTTPPPASYTIQVTANGSTAYTLSGTDRNGAVSGDNVTVNLVSGDTVNFEVSATGHPFWLKTSQNTGTGDGIPGVTNNGSEEDTVSYTFNSTGTFYYICEIHGSMVGEIRVT
ncbi:MAG: S8 family serine peptidase [Candidatus Thalassarchaeaceae archaeon]|jgi:subtilisin family serine protease/plastocyanin